MENIDAAHDILGSRDGSSRSTGPGRSQQSRSALDMRIAYPEKSTVCFIPRISAIGTCLTFAFVATALDLSFSTSLALWCSQWQTSPVEVPGLTATGTRFLDPVGALLSGSEVGVVRLLK